MASTTEKDIAFRKFIRIRERNQITLPAEILSGMAVHPGDFLEIGRTDDGSIYLKPTILVTVGSPEAAHEESLAEEDIANRRYETFDSAEAFIEDLKKKRRNVQEKRKEVKKDSPKKEPAARTVTA